jgi:hypothetical protein
MKTLNTLTKEEIETTHEKLRGILINYGSEEYGDCIVDEISWLFNYPTTVDITPEGGFVNDGNDYQLFDYVFHPFNTKEGFTSIEVRDFEDTLIGEIAWLEIPDENEDVYTIINFEKALKDWLEENEF